MYCSNCGEKIYNIMTVCPYCGQKFRNMQSLQKQSMENLYKQFIPKLEQGKKEFQIGDNVITFEEQDIALAQYWAVLACLVDYNEKIANQILEKYTTLDDLIEHVTIAILTEADNIGSIAYALIKEVDGTKLEREEILNGLIKMSKLEENLNTIETVVTQINNLIEQLAQKRQQQRRAKVLKDG